MLKNEKIVRGMVLTAIVVLCLAPWNRTAGQNDKVNSGVFEWVRSYYGPEYPDGAAANEILGSVVDGEGNNVNVNLNANWPDGMGLTGTLTANAELGDHNIDAGWNSHAYVARYTASTLTLTLTLTSTLTLTLTLTALTASTNRRRRGVVESIPTQPEVPFR